MKMLLLDDESFQLGLMEHQLRRLGFTDIASCQRAAEALDLLDDGVFTPDVVLCDLQMPEMDGVEFVQALEKRHYDGAVVFVSGEDERILQSVERLARAYRLRVLGVIRKPVTIEGLQAMLQTSEARSGETADPMSRHVYIDRELKAAIASGQLVNYYQPKVVLRSAQVVGMEALVRWVHPEDGLIFPDQFIGLAEEHDLINALTYRVLRLALRHVAHWRGAGFDLTVSVNVSMASLTSVEFVDVVSDEIERAQVPASSLILEVTESCLMQDSRGPLDILNRLRLRRVGLSIDDFGTGYSSLAQLRDIPFTELKMDRSFVHDAYRDHALQAMLEANFRMAEQLSMTTVAEGVENAADWNYLASTGCDLAQGYFVSKPMPATVATDWLSGLAAQKLDTLPPAPEHVLP